MFASAFAVNVLPGVSVTMTGEMFQNIYVGDTLEMVCTVRKLGANLGFTEMKALDAQGRTIARVAHIKYLNMGML